MVRKSAVWLKGRVCSRSRTTPGVLVGSLVVIFLGAAPAPAELVITPTFTDNFNTNFGANAAAAQESWKAAAKMFTDHFNDNIHINVTVDAVKGTGVFGQSNFGLVSTPYANLVKLLKADAKSADDFTATGPGGSVTAVDPAPGKTWVVTNAQAKAIGLIPDDTTASDGKTTFGAGNKFTFSGPIAKGTSDFMGIAAHEISEVMGRWGSSNTQIKDTYSLIDLFSYTGPGVRSLGNGAGSFSIDNGTTLLKAFNDASKDGLDTRDWADTDPATPDSFDQREPIDVFNPVTDVDLRLMDVIGYDAVPEPSSAFLAVSALIAGVFMRRRMKRQARAV